MSQAFLPQLFGGDILLNTHIIYIRNLVVEESAEMDLGDRQNYLLWSQRLREIGDRDGFIGNVPD